MKNLGQFTKHSINTVAVQFIILGASAATSIITARFLGPEGKGQLTLFFLIPWLAITFGRMGIGHAVNFYANKTSPTKLIVNSFVLSIFLSVLLVFISLHTVYIFKDIFFRTISGKLIIIVLFLIPFYLFNNHFIGLLQGLYKINILNLLLISQSVLNLVLLIILILIHKLDINGAIISTIIALLFFVFLSGLFLLKEIKVKEISLDFRLMKQLLNFGFKSHIGNILKDLNYRGDILIISYFLLPAYVGYYVIAVTIAEIIWKIPDAVGTVLLPRVAIMNKEEAKSFTPKICRIIFLLTAVICLAIFILREKIITFAFGIQYQPSISALALLIPGILSFSIWKILANDMIAQGYPTKYSFTSALALVTMILMDLYLVPIYGIDGAAAASTISYMVATAYIVFLYTRITKNTIKSLIVPLKSDFVFYKDIIVNIINLNRLGSIIYK